MASRLDGEEPSFDSAEEDKMIRIAFRAASSIPYIHPESPKIVKPVTLAEIRAGLARKAALAAQKRELDALQQTEESLPEKKEDTPPDPPPVLLLKHPELAPSTPSNPLFAIIQIKGRQLELDALSSDSWSPGILPSHASTQSSQYSSTSSSSSSLSTESQSKVTKIRRSSRSGEQRVRIVLSNSPSFPNCIEYISNKASSSQSIDVAPSTIADAGWNVTELTASGVPYRIGKILMKPEVPEDEIEEEEEEQQPKSSTETAFRTIRQASLLADSEDIQAKEEASQVGKDPKDTLLKLYDYFDFDSNMPQGSPINSSFYLDDFDIPEATSPRPLPKESTQERPDVLRKMSALPGKISPKRVHFADPPYLTDIPFESEKQQAVEIPSQRSALLPSQSLDRRDHSAYQSQLSEMQRVRGDSLDDTQWSADSDVVKPRPSKLKNFKDMLWR